MKNIFRGKSRILEPGAEVEFPPLVDGGENRAQMVHIHIGNFSATCVLWLGEIYLACAWARDESWQLWIGSWCFNTEKFVAFFLAVLEMSVEISQLWEILEILWNQLKLPHAIAVELSRSSFHVSLFHHFPLRPTFASHILRSFPYKSIFRRKRWKILRKQPDLMMPIDVCHVIFAPCRRDASPERPRMRRKMHFKLRNGAISVESRNDSVKRDMVTYTTMAQLVCRHDSRTLAHIRVITRLSYISSLWSNCTAMKIFFSSKEASIRVKMNRNFSFSYKMFAMALGSIYMRKSKISETYSVKMNVNAYDVGQYCPFLRKKTLLRSILCQTILF